ncbi:ABC transporter substrate-binding protein [Clostridium vincentii]|uniref:ABC transporter substrate binding protein n=1 Tax=Clostridium vincentii TaxID=52704 RepID=A0A2T0BB43_9CLOT|nr:ABC transporter substrate-binding protein [Clostridium vincentii]PRR81126.1 ABC transporter substrate binding protein [Clostridium vincentii]
MVGKKKIGMLLAGILTASTLVGCGSSSTEEVKEIGILQLVQHTALDQSNEGFIAGLKEKGYEEGENIKIDQQNANGKIDVTNQIAGQFVSNKKDLIFAIATPAVQAVYNATKDIPIVFTAVTDPVDAEIAKDWTSSGYNTTGTSDKVSIAEQLELFKKLVPDAKTMGFIYTTSEINSINQLKEIKDLAPNYGLTIKEIGIANINEINQNLSSALGSIDALYAPTDNNVAASYSLVGNLCVTNNIPIIGAEPAVVEQGGLVSKGIDYYELGKMAGYKAAEILDGTKPADIEIEAMTELAITINTDVAKKLNITIPDDIDKIATKVTGGVN